MPIMNKCIFVDASNELSARPVLEKYLPHGGQSLVKVHYSGINPADLNHAQHLGMNNNVCGYEICGTVIEVGPISPYAVGDVIFGSNCPGISRPGYHGGHQDFVIVESDSMVIKAPVQLPHPDAAALGVMVRTASDALMNLFQIPFAAIGVSGPPVTGGLLIWGGASTVGTAAIQLAKVMGISPIYTTASSSNHGALMKLGATKCFDYRDPHVVEDVQSTATQNGFTIKFILDTVCKEGNPGTIQQCEAIGTTPGVVFVGCLPQIGNPAWEMAFASRAIDAPVPGGIKANMEWESRLIRAVTWAAEHYGSQFSIPNVKIVKGAQEGIQAIKDVHDGKVSFSKVVIEHPL